jgi:NAD(P)-dependent dehydrogenase (short-subunit alcohol dehydrogenase family)
MRALVLGAGGTTGRLVAARLAALNHDVVLGVRDPARMSAPPVAGAEVRRCEVTDRRQVAAAFEGIDGVVLCAGPFETLGRPVIETVVDRGLVYSDVAGEPGWARHVHEDLHDAACRSGARLVPAAGASPGLGDLLATALAGQGARAVFVGYRISRYRPSVGSFRSALKLAAAGALVLEGGELIRVAAGSRQRRIGDSWGVLFPMPDPVVVSRHLDIKHAEVFVLANHLPGALAASFKLSRQLVRHGPVERLLASAAVVERRREASGGIEATVVVEGDAGVRTGSARARNVYEMTSEFAARALHAAATARPGVHSPGQLMSFDDFAPEYVSVRVDPA